jgi:hypothetical protein
LHALLFYWKGLLIFSFPFNNFFALKLLNKGMDYRIDWFIDWFFGV